MELDKKIDIDNLRLYFYQSLRICIISNTEITYPNQVRRLVA